MFRGFARAVSHGGKLCPAFSERAPRYHVAGLASFGLALAYAAFCGLGAELVQTGRIGGFVRFAH